MKSNIKINYVEEVGESAINDNEWLDETVEYTGKVYIRKVNNDQEKSDK